MAVFPEKQKRGFKVHRDKENEILDALLKGRALPGLYASQTPKGVQILGGGGQKFQAQWTLGVRYSEDDTEYQVSVKQGYVIGNYYLDHFTPATFDGTAYPGTETVWASLPNQTGENTVYLKIRVEGYPTIGGQPIEDTDDGPVTNYVPGSFRVFDMSLEVVTGTLSKTGGGLVGGYNIQEVVVGLVDLTSGVEITQILEGALSIGYPVIYWDQVASLDLFDYADPL